MTSKPNETDSQTNIYIELVNRIYGKTKSMLDWPLYTLPQQRMSLTHFPLKGVLGVKGANFDTCHPEEFFKGNLLLYKVASPGKTPEKTESMLD